MIPPPQSPKSQLLAIVERSPAAVAAQDKTAWLGLFTRDGVVEDPVGSAPNRRGAGERGGQDELARFYDTFIAGNKIWFEVRHDLIAGDEVVRDVVIGMRLSTGLSLEVPAYLIYQVEAPSEGGGGGIRRLRAVWDLRRRSVAALSSGWRGAWTLIVFTGLMFRIQGLRHMVAYSRGLITGIFGAGAQAASLLARAVGEGSEASAAGLCTPDVMVDFPAGAAPLGLGAWLVAIRARFGEGATMTLDRPLSAGFLTGFRYALAGAGGRSGGVAFLEFDPATKKINRARFFERA